MVDEGRLVRQRTPSDLQAFMRLFEEHDIELEFTADSPDGMRVLYIPAIKRTMLFTASGTLAGIRYGYLYE